MIANSSDDKNADNTRFPLVTISNVSSRDDVPAKLSVMLIESRPVDAEVVHISRHGVEEFISDNVIVLRNVLAEEKCRRTIQVLKMRGDVHSKGEYPFTISHTGITILPLSAMELTQESSVSAKIEPRMILATTICKAFMSKIGSILPETLESSNERIGTGNSDMDTMTNGGIFRDSIFLVSGPTGGGKTLMSAMFAAEGCRAGEHVLLLAYEESREQLLRNASS